MGHTALDRLGNPSVIIRIHTKENQESLCQRRRSEDGRKRQSEVRKKP